MTRLRVDHTGLNSTLFLVGKNNNDNCGVKENFEDVIFDRVLYEVERRVWQNRVQEVGREWNLMGILGSEGKREGIRIIRKAIFKFLNDTGLMRRI